MFHQVPHGMRIVEAKRNKSDFVIVDDTRHVGKFCQIPSHSHDYAMTLWFLLFALYTNRIPRNEFVSSARSVVSLLVNGALNVDRA